MVKATKLIIAFIISGTSVAYSISNVNQVALLQNRQTSTQVCPTGLIQNKKLTHPFIQTMIMFMGEALCLAYLYWDMRKNGKKYRSKQDMAKFGGRYRTKTLYFALGAFLDLMSTGTYLLAMDIIGGSTFSILRSARILILAFCLKFFTNIVFEKHQISGSVITVIGLFLVDVSDVFGADNFNLQSSFSWESLVLIVLSMFFTALHITYQQQLFLYYYTEPFRLVGFEGLFGMAFCGIVLIILNFVQCPFDIKQCVCSDGKSYIDYVPSYFHEIADQQIIILFALLYMISCGIFNLYGAQAINVVNGLARSVIEPLKVILVWIIGIILTVTVDEQSKYGKWESIYYLTIILKLVGFVIVVFGILLYFELIRIKRLSSSRRREDDFSIMTDQD